MSSSLASAGDANGDGYDDVVAGCAAGPVYLIYGGPSPWISNLTFEAGYPSSLGCGLDFNGDDFGDLAVSSSNRVSIFHGGPDMDNVGDTSMPAGGLAVSLGDINKDGYEDLLKGGIAVVFGNGSGDNIADVLLELTPEQKIVGTGDMNKDGTKEIFVRSSGRSYVCSLASFLALPEITLSSPQDGESTGLQTLDIHGAVKAPVVKLTVSGQEAPIELDGGFTSLINLEEGENLIEILAWTPEGKIAKRILKVTHAQPAPLTIAFTAPADGSTVDSTPVAVSGTVSELSATVTVNGAQTPVENGVFSTTVPLSQGPNTITATAMDQYGRSVSRSITVTLSVPAPTVSRSVAPTIIVTGETATLSWSSTNAQNCNIDQGIGTVAPNGSTSVSPAQTTTYTITATGPGGTATATAAVVVREPPPVISLSADPAEMAVPGRVVLTWSTTRADSCVIEPSIGAVPVNGAIGVFPTQTTQYTLEAAGSGGTSSKSLTVAVLNPAPSATLWADPQIVEEGASSTLSWTSANATACSIEPGVGSVEPNGAISLVPAQTTTYTLTVTGPGGAATARARVYIGDAYSYGDPAIAEQVHLEAINRARSNPRTEAARLGIDLDEGLAPGTIDGSPVQPLVFNSRLIQAARLHSQDMLDRQYFSHTSHDGRTPLDRMAEVGYAPRYAGENIGNTGSEQPLDMVAQSLLHYESFFIDSNVAGRVHRLNLLNGNFKEAGAGFATGPFEGLPYGFLLTCDFAASSKEPNAFLTGVVYEDKNSDGVYSAGEGIKDVEITVLEAGGRTLICSTGGYAVLLSPGVYTVEALLSDGRISRKKATLSESNVKVDFLLGEFTTPGASPEVSLTADPGLFAVGGSTTISWSSLYATGCVIEPGIGAMGPEGSVEVSPSQTTTYRITATGSGGSAAKEVKVYVYDPAGPVSVSLSAEPALIEKGQASTLAWTSLNAVSVSIDNGIGSVALEGSVMVHPQSSTTYVITATGPGGTASSSVAITLIAPPAATISATPEAIYTGQSATLGWSSTDAASAVIDQGIGSVDPTGSISVAPSQTTTYTLTVTGPGGTATASATISVTPPLPEVSLSASPQTIQAGQSATLSWSSAFVDAVSIEPGIGSVGLSGSLAVSPAQTTTYTISATGIWGTATASATVTVLSAISIAITSPLPYELIEGRSVIVQGTVTNVTGNETGVNINGTMAQVFGNEFVANHVPLNQGENMLIATAADLGGNSASGSITINSETSYDSIRVSADIESGVLPFETTLRVTGSFAFSESTLIPVGPGAVEVLEKSGVEYGVKISTEGIYLFTVEVIDAQNRTFSDTVAVVVLDRARLDGLLRAKWNGMRSRLMDRDVDGALEYFAVSSRNRYRQIFTALQDSLPDKASSMEEIELVYSMGNVAKYRIGRDQLIDGVIQKITYYIHFAKDEGIWFIDDF